MVRFAQRALSAKRTTRSHSRQDQSFIFVDGSPTMGLWVAPGAAGGPLSRPMALDAIVEDGLELACMAPKATLFRVSCHPNDGLAGA